MLLLFCLELSFVETTFKKKLFQTHYQNCTLFISLFRLFWFEINYSDWQISKNLLYYLLKCITLYVEALKTKQQQNR